MPNNRRLLGLTGAEGQVLTAHPGRDLGGSWDVSSGGGGGSGWTELFWHLLYNGTDAYSGQTLVMDSAPLTLSSPSRLLLTVKIPALEVNTPSSKGFIDVTLATGPTWVLGAVEGTSYLYFPFYATRRIDDSLGPVSTTASLRLGCNIGEVQAYADAVHNPTAGTEVYGTIEWGISARPWS